MIHPAARRAVGWVEVDGAPAGHAVLVGPREAVTCAHVISEASEKPGSTVRVNFPNIPLDVTATISAWQAYDPRLTAGSDIAVLDFADGQRAPADSWARLDETRPGTCTPVATLDFLVARIDGDAREGSVLDGTGAFLSLIGDHLIEPNMSGTGLFHREPGERLLGLVSGRPIDAQQTSGYAVPADEIARAIAGPAEAARSADNTRLEIETLVAMALGVVGDNLRGVLQELATEAFCTLARPPAEWLEEDLNALHDLQLELRDAIEPTTENAEKHPLPVALAAMFRNLDALIAHVFENATDPGAPLALDREMERLLREALAEIDHLFDRGLCPDGARRAIEQMAGSCVSRSVVARRASGNSVRAANWPGAAAAKDLHWVPARSWPPSAGAAILRRRARYSRMARRNGCRRWWWSRRVRMGS